MNPKSKDFQALQKTWYKKLKQEGFEDIEQADGHLKLWSAYYFRSKYKTDGDVLFQQAKEEYYRLARQFLHEKSFEDIRTKRIWELHSEGMSIRNIVKVLKQEGHVAYKNIVHPIVKALSKEMIEKPSHE